MTVYVDIDLSDACRRGLELLGCSVMSLPTWDCLPEPVCGHPDLLTAPLPDGSLLLPQDYYEENASFWDNTDYSLVTAHESVSSPYPRDVVLDALAVGDCLYGRADAVAKALLSRYSRFVSVKQGYARCSVALLSERAAITADRGLAKALEGEGVEVLRIRPGYIALPGYSCGFIGGAGGRLTDDTYVFFGDLASHPDGEAMRRFCDRQKISAVSLSDEPLRDHGGILVRG